MTSTPHILEVACKAGTATFELEQKGRRFKVRKAFVAGRPELRIGFDPSSADEVLDENSDARQVFNIATRIRLLGCTLANDEFVAPDIETLGLALKRAKLRFWNPEEI